VVEKFVLQLEAQLSDRNVTFELSPEATAWLAARGYDEAFGARPLARLIQEAIKKPLADEILFGRLLRGGTVKVMVNADGSGLAFEIIEAPVLPASVAPDGNEAEGGEASGLREPELVK
jgi:ATP-dependent Clp protease ATP-binding subunit ClpA